MDESSSGGYLLLDREKPKPLSSGNQSTSPSDPYNLIYFSLLLAGIAFLLPYNSFVTAVDYFQSRYPSTTIIFDMSTIYILMAFITVIMNNVLVEAIPLFWRINFGYGLSFLVLVFVTIVEISAQLGGYKLNLMAVAIVAIGSTVQQSSFYGYTSMLPKRYTHSVMIGESMAGLIVSANRITTKLLFPNDEKLNTILFFSISIAIVIICGIIHSLVLPKTDFIKFYINSCASSASNVMQINQNESLGLKEMFRNNDSEYGRNKFGVLSIDTDDYCKLNGESSGRVSKISGRISKLSLERESNSPIFQRQVSTISRSESTDFVLPFGIDDEELSFEESLKNVELDNSKNNVEDSFDDNFYIKIEEKQTFFKRNFKWKSCENWISIMRAGIASRIEVSKLIWPQMLSIMIAYFVTLSLFPGVESEIKSCELGSWMPVILMAIFNFTDFCGKILASLCYRIGPSKLTLFSFLRIFLIPFLLLCAARPVPKHHFAAYVFTSLLGITNGILGSLPMILAPMYVSDNMKELTGNIMTFSYSIGLTLGSFFSYLLNYALESGSVDFEFWCKNESKILIPKQHFDNSFPMHIK